MAKKTSKTSYIRSVGRRKSAVATVKLFSGKGDCLVNGIQLNKYFPTKTEKIVYDKPFEVTKTLGKYYFSATIIGGGKTGQVQALSLALARCLIKIDESFKPILRANGLVTVDSRVKERRMVGTGGKARRQKQSPKR
ncbi:MAG TPA: 30S ribosomal protein S9 [Candidatus Woesebacteria bacterium]|jgi:small subunit ribosomal protein S9|nr:30S ribosomal protein S9 [Candidatus Woesebacteria bacterium]